jgi:hypothetical protein
MYIRKTTKISKGKTYTHYLLVESVHTPKGPRQRTICSLGSLGPGPLEQWHALARKVEAALAGQRSLEPTALPLEPRVDKAPPGPQRPGPAPGPGPPVAPEPVALAEARAAGPVHVGHQIWQPLGLEAMLRRAGVSAGARVFSEVMTLHRLISVGRDRARCKPFPLSPPFRTGLATYRCIRLNTFESVLVLAL